MEDFLLTNVLSGKKHDDPHHVDYIPSVFTYRCAKPDHAKRYDRLLQRRLRQQQSSSTAEQYDIAITVAAEVLCSLSHGTPKLQCKGDLTLNTIYKQYSVDVPVAFTCLVAAYCDFT